MLRPRITPCLLVHDGGLVKTRQFKDPRYVGDPLNAVKIFNEKEVDELLVLDIDASAQGRAPDLSMLKGLAVESRMPLCYGGGVSSADQAARIVALGFEKVSVSSAALARPELIREIAQAVGRQSVVVTLDVRKNRFLSGYTVFTHNGRDKHKVDMLEFCRNAVELGAGEIVINAIDRDGEMAGYDLDLARSVRAAVSSPISMVGGAGTVQHMQELLDAIGVAGAVAGSMFVFKGPYRAVLINYARPSGLR
jgi:imidazole glycerol-phosphate synthase subunit HisF